eukprot:595232-Pleurochrysis_carterae.AAC.2
MRPAKDGNFADAIALTRSSGSRDRDLSFPETQRLAGVALRSNRLLLTLSVGGTLPASLPGASVSLPATHNEIGSVSVPSCAALRRLRHLRCGVRQHERGRLRHLRARPDRALHEAHARRAQHLAQDAHG